MTYLRWADYAAWSQCAGRPALEESEGEVPDAVPALSVPQRSDLEARKAALAGASAVEVLPLQSLPVGAITGERGALAFGSLILAEYPDHSSLEVYPADPILALAALVKYSILHNFTQTNVGSPEELYEYGARVTEAAQLSLNLRASVTALEHLVPGEYCATCRAAYRCPALTKQIRAQVVGPLQDPNDEEAVPVPFASGLNDPETLKATVRAAWLRLPAVQIWVAQVTAAARRLRIAPKPSAAAPPTRRKPRKARARRAAPASPGS
jgi:hypothetical protein